VTRIPDRAAEQPRCADPDHPRSSRRHYKVFVEDYKHHRLDDTSMR
jgi:hypothetical protein